MRRQVASKNSTMQHRRRDYIMAGDHLAFWETRFQPAEKPGDPWKPLSYLSPRFKQFLGYNQEDLLTYEDWKSLIHPDDVATVFKAIDEHTRNKKPYDLEYSMRTKSGEYRRFHVKGQAVWDEMGNKIRMAGWIATKVPEAGPTDPTQLRECGLLRAAKVGTFHADTRGQLRIQNVGFRRILGITDENALPSSWTDLVIAEDLQEFQNQWTSAIRLKAPLHHEFRIVDRLGSTHVVMMDAEPELDGKGRIKSFMGTLTDITDVMERERSLRGQIVSLEDRVTEFLSEIEAANEVLRRQSTELQEANIALSVLMKRRSQEEAFAEERMLLNLKEMVLPFLQKLRLSCRAENQAALLNTIEENLNDITSPLLGRLTSGYIGLTQQELRVAKLVRDGKLTKEIASLLNISENVVKTHRAHIRNKMKLNGKKLSLREMLQKLADK